MLHSARQQYREQLEDGGPDRTQFAEDGVDPLVEGLPGLRKRARKETGLRRSTVLRPKLRLRYEGETPGDDDDWETVDKFAVRWRLQPRVASHAPFPVPQLLQAKQAAVTTPLAKPTQEVAEDQEGDTPGAAHNNASSRSVRAAPRKRQWGAAHKKDNGNPDANNRTVRGPGFANRRASLQLACEMPRVAEEDGLRHAKGVPGHVKQHRNQGPA